MSRLTDKDSYCLMHCADDYDSGIDEDCNINKICFERKMYDKLKHYEDLADEGRLIELPCKVGDTVYVADKSSKQVHPFIVEYFYIGEYENTIMASYDGKELKFQHWKIRTSIERFNEFFNLTKAEAEAKLAELKGGAE